MPAAAQRWTSASARMLCQGEHRLPTHLDFWFARVRACVRARVRARVRGREGDLTYQKESVEGEVMRITKGNRAAFC